MSAEDHASGHGSAIEYHSASEYGSVFDDEEETLIGDLLSQLAETAPTEKSVIYQSVETDHASAIPTVVIHSSPPSAVVRVGKGVKVEERESPSPPTRHHSTRSPSVEFEYDSRSRDAWNLPREDGEEGLQSGVDRGDERRKQPDTRTPLQRFRTKPKKPLSVTDLVSPAWCELQFWYNLTRFGRKPQTEAMKQGSKIHRKLEEEVHTIVPIEVQTKEDRFGLRIWNVIQGLRTLKTTGMTRELEVWGVINGQIVNGVIDELSYTCPDPAFEASLEKSKGEKARATLPLGQLTIGQTLAMAGMERNHYPKVASERVVYLTDTKTRNSRSVPIGARLRPIWMQLMLYRRLVESLALNTVDADTVFLRYNVEPLHPFTDTFMREVSNLGGRSQSQQPTANVDSLSDLGTSDIQSHNNLMALWSLMIAEYQHTIGSVSEVLRAEFRYARTGEIIGNEITAYDSEVIENYVADELSWWKGEREAKGVEVEEAYKCRTCDFAEECVWRKKKVDEAIEKSRLRAFERAKSTV